MTGSAKSGIQVLARPRLSWSLSSGRPLRAGPGGSSRATIAAPDLGFGPGVEGQQKRRQLRAVLREAIAALVAVHQSRRAQLLDTLIEHSRAGAGRSLQRPECQRLIGAG